MVKYSLPKGLGLANGPATKRAAGCVVYRRDEAGALKILLIHDKYGNWTLPKGHLEDGESEAMAAAREVFEETCVAGEPGPLIDRIDYVVLSKGGRPRAKQVAFFLMPAASVAAIPQADEGISAASWFAPEQALVLIGYPQVRAIVARALQMLHQTTPLGG
jgi:8-oxo-dGTP pyrophosphatase MutT (NUDIX family)